MRSRRSLALLAGLLVAACGGDAGESTAGGGEAAPQAASTAEDEGALVALAEYYETHYNMHHASMVAETFQEEESGFLTADGMVLQGRAAIQARLEADMAGSPTLSVETDDQMVFGDVAVGRGTYTVQTTPEGAPEPMSMSGSWMASYDRQEDGSWKLGWLAGNLDHAWPEGMPAAPPGEAPAEEGTMGELIGAYETHFNLGHPSMVADLYTEDGWAAFAGLPAVSGREAISQALAQRIEANPVDIDIHEVGTTDIADGWAMDGGWYEMTPKGGGDPVQMGNFMGLLRRGDDGQWRLHWVVSNGWPAAAVPM